MRGKLVVLPYRDRVNGITPADAGKTFEFGQVPFGLEDHPRGCGENDSSKNVNMLCDGITPADAGKTICSDVNSSVE